ncbi:hypothetical protein FPZ12_025070 [Amycolatopsis acidicola]|uniref:SGNH hydrolase-type esterase domain-containing protein n=1 Tax=Amycolatopsis acidicola TaxID=2596893 RepID=A0A5N0V0A5_9PSEU|nr:GDSL-type esterase/lipase family protein [Amycolatopsis acidicola]KAA9157446.1 hypothetical protein FPZ12_025070 [Amycolatopsis acidicola]
MIELLPDDPRLGLRGHAELVREGGWWQPYRLPADHSMIHPELLPPVRTSAGVRLDLVTDATALEWPVEVSPVDSRPPAPVELLADGEPVARKVIRGAGVFAAEGLRPGARLEVWLPQFGSSRIGPVRLEGTHVEAGGPRPRWIAYGSSITQCAQAAGPSTTWPALVARANGWDLRCLGFAGQCHLDPLVARFVRDSPAGLISLCLGINIHRRASFTGRSLVPAIAGFVATIRDGHPETPIVLQTPIFDPDGETLANTAGLTMPQVRELLAEAAETLGLPLIDGRTVLTSDETHLLEDGLHPNAEGYRLMAERLTPLLGAHLPRNPAVAPVVG